MEQWSIAGGSLGDLRKHTDCRNKSGSAEGVCQVGKEDGGELVTADTRPTTPAGAEIGCEAFEGEDEL